MVISGKDAAGIANEAIVHAKEAKYDVVLVDTAGRMQDNEPLMRALTKVIFLMFYYIYVKCCYIKALNCIYLFCSLHFIKPLCLLFFS